jgi:curved DNA-binding protein CbpA
MGNTQSQIDPRHIGIYKKVLAIQNPQTRLQMIDTLMGDPSVIHSAKIGGVYAGVLQYSAAVRHGGAPPPLPGELSFPSNTGGQVLAPPQIQQRIPSNQPPPNQLQYHPQAFQTPPVQNQQSHQSQQLTQTNAQRFQDPYQQVAKPQRSQKALNFFSACLRVLNIQEEVALTEEALKAAYKKAVIKAHPDKPGGSKDAFDAVTRAYAYLIDILKLVQGRTTKTAEAVPGLDSVQEQRKSASQEWQMPTEPVKLNPKNLNMTVFNQLFEQTRVPDPDEDGYGDWLKNEGGGPMKKGSKKFSEDFNREVFNRMFEEEAHSQGRGNTAITAYQTQELMLSPTSGVELGRDRPADYTAPINSDLHFTDLRAAYTKENTVSNQIQGVRVENRDFQKYKAQRERAPDAYNPAELASLQAYESQQKAKEEQRRLRAAQEHISARDYFERMKQLVITEK